MFFKAAPNGHYSTKTELGEKTLPPDKIEIKVIGKKRRNEDDFFDERFQDRIEQRAKTNTLLTIDEKILICIYGYPGMGKTTLVEKVLWEIEKGKYPDNVLQNKWDGILYLQKEELKFDILFDRIKSLSPYEMQQELELVKRACQELDKKIIILLEVLKKERIIILLDGADDLFDENGKFKKECEDFKLFCKLALKNNIASKILITSNKPLEFYDEFSEEFDENFINEHTHTEELNEGLPKEFALSYLRALDENGRSGLKNATDDQLSRIAKITYGIPRALQLVHHLLSNKNNTDLNLDNIIDQFYDIEKVVKSFVEISNKKLDAVSKQIVEVLSIFNRPVPKEAIIFVLQNLLDKYLIITAIKNLAVTHLINWHRNEKFECVYSLPPIDQEYSYLHIPITGESYNCKELHSHAANYYELLGKEEDWKEIKTIEHPKIYEYEQLVKAKDFDKAASVIDSIDYSWTNHHKYLAHLMALGYGNYLIKHREKLEDKLSNKSLEACNLTSLGWLCRRMGRKKEAEKHLSDAVELARESASDLPQIYALSELGYFYTDNAGKHDEAENHLKEALKIAIKSRDIYSQANIYLGLAFVCFQRPGENDASLANAKRSLDLFSKLTTPLAYFRQIDCWDRLGMIYRKMGLFSDAMRTAEEGLKIAENHGFIDWKAELYSSKGFHLRAQGLFTEAIESHEVALNLFEKKCGMKREEAVQYGYLANLYAELGLLDKAFAAYEKAYIIVNEVGLRRELSWILSNKGALLCKLGNYEEALRLQQSALNIVIENDHFDSQVIRYTDLAVTQFLMQQYTESESSLHQALRCASINEKKELPTDFPEEFLRASVQEDNLPHEMQSPDDHTRRGVILARIYLHKGKVKEALKIIQHVNKFQNKLSPNKHITMAVYAITLHNEGKNIQKAIDAYKKTIEISDKLLVSEPDYYPAINSKGLAFIGLSLLMQGRIVEKYKNESKKTLTYGQKICNAKGVQKDIILLLKNLPVNQKFIKSIFPT